MLDWDDPPFAKWFVGGKLNAAYNCVDRHVENGLGDRVAFHWFGEPADDRRTLTYSDLQDEVCKAANGLLSLGVEAGDRVAIYLPMIPETVIAMLACVRIGAVHTVVFGGFSADALVTRITDLDARVVITADGGYRRGAPSALKPAVDEAMTRCPDVRTVLVVKRTGQDVEWDDDRDQWWHDVVDDQSTTHEPELFDAEHPLYVMYTSGSTGKPKGILHTTGGYLTQAAWTHWAAFDLKADTDIYWCSADIGWVTGHSYIVYGPLANATTSVMYEGTPDTPHKGRWWEIIQELGVTLFYTAPTAIRTCMKWGKEIPAEFDLSSLRVLGSVGEPINPEAYIWYRDNIGGAQTPGRRHLVADRDRRDHDQPAARRHRRQARLGDAPAARHRRRGGRRAGQPGARTGPAATWCSPSRGRRCCGRCGATTSGTRTRTGRATPVATSPATARRRTTTATCGCSAGSTT